VTFVKVLDLVRRKHQVMVFVHTRKDTVKTAQALRESVLEEGAWDDFDPSSHPQFGQFRREISGSRNKEMKQLFDSGFGIHHAGMLRSDRNMMERMFEARAINVRTTNSCFLLHWYAQRISRSFAALPRWPGA
jgi:antiviral helicase SLH1